MGTACSIFDNFSVANDKKKIFIATFKQLKAIALISDYASCLFLLSLGTQQSNYGCLSSLLYLSPKNG